MEAAKTAPGWVSIEEYLRSDYEPDAEYVDGAIEERPMGVGEIWVVKPEGPEFFCFQDGKLRRRAEFGRAGQAMHFPLRAIAELLPARPQLPEQA